MLMMITVTALGLMATTAALACAGCRHYLDRHLALNYSPARSRR